MIIAENRSIQSHVRVSETISLGLTIRVILIDLLVVQVMLEQ